MFSHVGKARTARHNFAIAILLSFVAGLVNVVGFFTIKVLTTNVTGHFAFFIDEVFKLNFYGALHLALYVLAFFLGAFTANLLVETSSRIRETETYIYPVLAEACILGIMAFSGFFISQEHAEFIAFSLLFAMGMQNSLVTSISNNIVRTTHLTGLFTDMGIECSQLFFYRDPERRRQLLKSIRLRFAIILFFFIGGVCGAVMHTNFGLRSLLLGSVLLLGGLLYDYLKIKFLLVLKK